MCTKAMDAKTAVSVLEDKLEELEKQLNDKLDQLEVECQQDNLKFFGIPKSIDESFSVCAH